LSDGGLAVALAESSFGDAGVGARIEVPAGSRPEFTLFHEAPSRILVSTAEPDKVIAIAYKNQVAALRIGVTMKERIQISSNSELLVDSSLDDIKQPWEHALERELSRP
jgi:phosphoribosylformylglycinamidine synthase